MGQGEQMTKKVLNVGCGKRIMNGAVNHDLVKHSEGVDIAHDLNITPWPFQDNHFDQIISRAVFEHLDIDLVASLNECHRILKVGGRLDLKLPLQNGGNAYDDPTHRWFFTLKSLDYFVPSTKYGDDYSFYTTRKWKYIKPPHPNKSKTSLFAVLQKV